MSSVRHDDQLCQDLLDTDRLECTDCGERPAVVILGPYADIALCDICYGSVPMDDLNRGMGEFA
jgi:hypothetical protein